LQNYVNTTQHNYSTTVQERAAVTKRSFFKVLGRYTLLTS